MVYRLKNLMIKIWLMSRYPAYWLSISKTARGPLGLNANMECRSLCLEWQRTCFKIHISCKGCTREPDSRDNVDDAIKNGDACLYGFSMGLDSLVVSVYGYYFNKTCNTCAWCYSPPKDAAAPEPSLFVDEIITEIWCTDPNIKLLIFSGLHVYMQ